MRNDQPHPVDVHVGLRLRAMRRELGLSQEAMADAVGLTFQQIQKYEKGANRVSASKLWQFAGVLSKTPDDFYAGLGAESVTASPTAAKSVAVMAASGGPELVDAYLRMPPPTRRALVDLAKVICGGEA